VEKKLATTRRFKDDLFSRLRHELPEAMQAELRSCIDRHPIPEPSGVRVAHELGLTERINQALGQLSILVIELPAEQADDVLDSILAALQESEGKFSAPTEDGESRLLTTAFDCPDDAIQFVRQTLTSHEESSLSGVRGMLLAGLNVTEFDQDSVNKLFARTLHGARAILDSAPEEGLLVDGSAYEQAADRAGFELHSQTENLRHLPWEQLNVEDGAEPEGDESDQTTQAPTEENTDADTAAEAEK
ncbi:MAG: hypothetical protein HOC05_08845, partial [Gemmatimonadetes bacterium]|nr:hypothetical protein [Gemmatimonadota bacterium]